MNLVNFNVGVRDYYRTQGFVTDSEEGCYQIKSIGLDETNNEEETNNKPNNETNIVFNHKNFLIFVFVIGFIFRYICIKIIFYLIDY